MENNRVKILNLNKKIPQKIKLIKTGVAVLIVSCSLAFLVACGAKEPIINPVPDDQIEYTIEYRVKNNDTVSEISELFYDSDCKAVYNSFDTYLHEISARNNLKNFHIEYGDKLDIPVIIDKNNEYYLKILEIKEQIKELEETNLWIDHIVQSGESFSYYGSLVSDDYNRTLYWAAVICERNNMARSDLQIGSKIEIMNPKLGKLRLELKQVKEELYNSLIENSKTK